MEASQCLETIKSRLIAMRSQQLKQSVSILTCPCIQQSRDCKVFFRDKQGAISYVRESTRLFQQQGNTANYEYAQNQIKKLGD